MKSLFSKLMMVIFLISLAVMGVYSISEAADWKYFITSGLWDGYYDTESVRYEGNIVKVWIKRQIKDDTALLEYLRERAKKGLSTAGYENFSYELALIEINLYTREYRISTSTDYDKDGNVLSRDTPDYPEWTAIPPDSVIETLYNILKARTTE